MTVAGGFVKLPARFAREAVRGSVSMVDLEDAILAGFVLRWWELGGHSPTMTQLAHDARRGWHRAKNGIHRLVERGSLTARKVPYERGDSPGEYSARWEFAADVDSPGMIARNGSAWIAVPAKVARAGVIAVAAYLVLSEQMRIDKAIVTTPADLARVLKCSRSTARRALEACGVKLVARRGRSVVYVMETPTDRVPEEVLKVCGELVACRSGVIGRRDSERRERLREALGAARVDPDGAEALAIRTIRDAGVSLTLPTLVRVCELLHARELRRFAWAWPRMGARLRGQARAQRVFVKHERARRERALQDDCGACRGDGVVFVAMPGYADAVEPCPECSGGAPPPSG